MVEAAGAVAVVDLTAAETTAAQVAAQEAASELLTNGVLTEAVAIETDHTTDSVTVVVPDTAPPGAATAVAAAVDEASQGSVTVDVEETATSPQLSSAPLKGGDRISSTQFNSVKVDCTVSFMARNSSAQQFALTAGHCDNAIETTPFYFAGGGGPYSWFDGTVLIGKRAVTVFGNVRNNVQRTDDYALIRIDSPSRTQPKAVVRTAGADLPVAGVENAVSRTTLCKFGQVTGAGCGRVTAVNVTILWPWGRTVWAPVTVKVDNLINVEVCSRSGDSGGPLFRVSNGRAYAVGILSGGDQGTCPTNLAGRDSYYQPVREVLQQEGLTLLPS